MKSREIQVVHVTNKPAKNGNNHSNARNLLISFIPIKGREIRNEFYRGMN